MPGLRLRLDRVVAGRVGRGVPELATGAVQLRHALQRQQDRHRPGRRVGGRGDHLAHLPVLVDVGAHQRDVGVPLVQIAVLVFIRHGGTAPEVGHVDAARRQHRGHAGARRSQHPLRPGRQHTAADVIGDLGGSDVQHAGDKPAADQRFHGAPAGPRGVKDQHLVAGPFQRRLRAVDGCGGVAEHAGGDQRPVGSGRRRFRFHHAADRARRVGVDAPAEPVQPRHIHHRRHHGDVNGADVRRDVSRRDGGDHQLGHADRQRAHGRSGDGRPAAARHGQDAIQPPLLV